MRRSLNIASGDYTGTAYVGRVDLDPGVYLLSRVLARFAGTAAADGFLGVYVAAEALTTLSDAVRAAGEVWAEDAVGAAADPVPDVNAAGTPINFTLETGESLYVYWKSGTGDTTVSGTVKLEIL